MYEETSRREFMNSFDESLTPVHPITIPQSQSSKLLKQMTLIDDMGLIAETVDTFKPHRMGKETRNINTMKIGELWGIRSSRRAVVQGELTKAAHQLKYEYWKDNRKRDNLKNSPYPPHILDRMKVKTPDLRIKVEPDNIFRAFSPQLSPKHAHGSKIKLKKIDVINEIIQTCRNFPVTKAPIPKTKKLKIGSKLTRKLSNYEKSNIKSNIKILEYHN